MVWFDLPYSKAHKHHAFNWHYMFASKHTTNSTKVYYVLGKYSEAYWGFSWMADEICTGRKRM